MGPRWPHVSLNPAFELGILFGASIPLGLHGRGLLIETLAYEAAVRVIAT